MRRTLVPELLDADLGTPSELSDSLADLRRINAWFGGIHTTTAMLRHVAQGRRGHRFSLLEIGAGSGDVPLGAQRALSREGVELQVTLLDLNWTHLPGGGVPCLAGDALRLPLRDGAFDLVSCSLLAHHFEPHKLQEFAGEALRVCRRAVLINDLVRSRVHLGLVFLGLPLFRSRITRHDAIASVRRAYTTREMQELLRKVGGRRVEISVHYLYRMGIVLWK